MYPADPPEVLIQKLKDQVQQARNDMYAAGISCTIEMMNAFIAARAGQVASTLSPKEQEDATMCLAINDLTNTIILLNEKIAEAHSNSLPKEGIIRPPTDEEIRRDRDLWPSPNHPPQYEVRSSDTTTSDTSEELRSRVCWEWIYVPYVIDFNNAGEPINNYRWEKVSAICK